MPTAFAVVAEPHRRRILDLLREGERPVGELVAALDLARDVPAAADALRSAAAREEEPA